MVKFRDRELGHAENAIL